MEILYVTLSCAALTWFRWNQHIQGRSYPFVGISCLYAVWMLTGGPTIPLDGVTVATIALSLWMLGSLLWSQKGLCIYEFFNWLSYLILFTAARSIPLEWAMWILVPNAAILAALQIYNSTKYKIHHEADYYPLFGNSNHNAAFLLVGLYAALWLGVNVTPLMFGFVLMMGLAIIQSMRRGPLLALVCSLILLTVLSRSESLMYLTIIACVAAIPNRARILLTFHGYFINDRMEIYKDAWKRIHPRYLLGRGLNYYRDTKYGRVHNDHLELVGEIGFIGYALFLNIFFQMNLDPIILCAVVAYMIDAMFFYPFREQHTVAPFWLMVGSAAGFGASSSLVLLQIVGALVVGAIGLFVFTVYSNLVKWTMEEAKRRENQRVDCAALGQGARG